MHPFSMINKSGITKKISLLSYTKSGTFLVSLLFFACVSFSQPKIGAWEGELKLTETIALPFHFEVRYDQEIYSFAFQNADEEIETREIVMRGDSVFVQMPIFDSEFKICVKQNEMKGIWINHARKDKNMIPFHAVPAGLGISGKPFVPKELRIKEEKWETTFSPNSKESTKAIGIFIQENSTIWGTFLTETGDYRYLDGWQDGPNSFKISCFDGSHAFLFTGTIKGDSIVGGHFYSGAHHHETWVAKRNDKFQLRNPDSLTYLKPGFTKVDFNFKNLEGKNVSLQDEKFKNKVVIIQIMGSWCPNCMDETKFLAPFYDKYNSKGLEVVALAFERTDDFNKAVNNIQRSKTRFNAKYEFLITMKTGKDQASEALPMLNEVMAFPTTIYIDKKGIVRKIYTGFNGPATGDAHTKFVEETTRFVEKLLAE